MRVKQSRKNSEQRSQQHTHTETNNTPKWKKKEERKMVMNNKTLFYLQRNNSNLIWFIFCLVYLHFRFQFFFFVSPFILLHVLSSPLVVAGIKHFFCCLHLHLQDKHTHTHISKLKLAASSRREGRLVGVRGKAKRRKTKKSAGFSMWTNDENDDRYRHHQYNVYYLQKKFLIQLS